MDGHRKEKVLTEIPFMIANKYLQVPNICANPRLPT